MLVLWLINSCVCVIGISDRRETQASMDEEYPTKREQPVLGRTASDIGKLYRASGVSSGSRTKLAGKL